MTDEDTTTKAADVLPFSKAKQTARPAKAARATKATPTKAAKPAKVAKAKKAAKPKAEGGIVRAASSVPTEGEARDEFDGKMYPLKKFPTQRQSDGTYVRGTVTRANLPAWRLARKAKREADAKASAAAKAEAKKAADANKKAAAKS